MTIESYDWVKNPRDLASEGKIKPQYLYTMLPLRRVKLLEEEEEDPVVLIKRRVF